MMGYLLTVLMSGNGELAFYSGGGRAKRLLHLMKVLTRFNDGFNKVFQRAFEYAPLQEQESCKIHVKIRAA